MTACILCESCDLSLVEVLSGSVVADAWKSDFGMVIELPSEITQWECRRCNLTQFSPSIAGTMSLYEQLQSFSWYYVEDKFEYQKTPQWLSPSSTVLEIGAGLGEFVKYLPRDIDYVGLELNEKAIEAADSRGIRLRPYTIEEYSLSQVKVDTVVAFQVLEHVPNPRSFLTACWSCVKPGGSRVIAVPNADGFVGDAVNNLLNLPPHHMTHWRDSTFEWMSGWLGAASLEVCREPVSEAHRPWAQQVRTESIIRHRLGLSRKTVDFRVSQRILSRIAGRLKFALARNVSAIDGHTVLVRFLK